MTDAERREASRQFYIKWQNKGKEDEDDRSYWIDIFTRILDIKNATDKIEFQKKVIVDGNIKKIDAYIPETKIIIEQKSLGIDLDKKIRQSGDVFLTPYEQAKRYNDNLPLSEKARWIITSNFAEIWIYNMDTKIPEASVIKINISDLQNKYSLLDFLYNQERKKITEETEISIKAGELVGKLYQCLFDRYINPEQEAEFKSLNILCVRLVFCFYAEDSGLFGEKNAFSNFIEKNDAGNLRDKLIKLFEVLDTPEGKRDPYLSDEFKTFPYCNGGLFAKEDIIVPQFTEEIKKVLLETGAFDWRKISPTIFGAVFESTLNPEVRRSGGMHYTSIENIHKVIDPLFLDELDGELSSILEITNQNTKKQELEKFQNKVASLNFFDPACGSGNFLTETYISLRRLENKALREMSGIGKGNIEGQVAFAFDETNPIKVNINQFYGIEINDFAVTVAKTALWIAESQMMQETEDILHMNLDFLPLKTNATIVEGNALRIDWNDVLPSAKCNYIMGNPPFVGARLMSKEQKEDLLSIFGKDWKNAGNLDYVACWYKKCADYMKNTTIDAALVSTNSITQGETVANLWKPIFNNGIHINFAHKTFKWDSEANIKAHVYCVVVGFSYATKNKPLVIFNNEENQIVKNINAYLVDADNIFVESRNKPICDIPEIGIGNKPIDDGNYLFSEEEMKEFIKKEPLSTQYFRPWYGSSEFINQKPRYCLWLGDCTPNELKQMPECLKLIQAVKDFRLASKSDGTRKLAEKPTHFHVENMPNTTYLLVPRVSSEKRRYVPIGFMSPDTITSDSAHIIPDATLYDFGILTSNVHMAWMRAVCGRLEMRYRYSKDIVYNNFPWPTPTDEQKTKIEETAQGILDARALYPDSSLADLYNPLTMPLNLQKAHHLNDAAVMNAYGFDIKNTSEADCVAKLMEMYGELTKK